ncbi:proline-rich receptor-like protein kinase PERK3 [Arachis ipaensis]|uniref:proline-rich receptor-like protein kinase PERK3 n=1 Tax=Arachis ipaensis TaxID=130454 RepID=UPI000A2B625A|nr:proline-rich receptor-like protein kinase PERK3 [Arachis ipaensis]
MVPTDNYLPYLFNNYESQQKGKMARIAKITVTGQETQFPLFYPKFTVAPPSFSVAVVPPSCATVTLCSYSASVAPQVRATVSPVARAAVAPLLPCHRCSSYVGPSPLSLTHVFSLSIELTRTFSVIVTELPNSIVTNLRGAEHMSPAAPKFKGVQVFTYKEIEVATNGFSEANFIGNGGFGLMYRGVLSDGTLAAIKLLRREGKQGERAFRVEVS